jgi:hypothetical protein
MAKQFCTGSRYCSVRGYNAFGSSLSRVKLANPSIHPSGRTHLVECPFCGRLLVPSRHPNSLGFIILPQHHEPKDAKNALTIGDLRPEDTLISYDADGNERRS